MSQLPANHSGISRSPGRAAHGSPCVLHTHLHSPREQRAIPKPYCTKLTYYMERQRSWAWEKLYQNSGEREALTNYLPVSCGQTTPASLLCWQFSSPSWLEGHSSSFASLPVHWTLFSHIGTLLPPNVSPGTAVAPVACNASDICLVSC